MGIYDLIEPLVSAGTLVPRPKNVLENEINSYYAFTRDNLIVEEVGDMTEEVF